MKCMVCKATGANMRRCKKCGQVYCVECALKGRPPYPKIPARNICPMCGAHDKSETASERVMYPVAVSVHDIDGFLVVKITPRRTGLAHDLYFECKASERLADYTPYFYACKENWLIPILISDNPCVIDKGNEESDFADTIEWAKRNQGVLIKHWYGEVDDPQLIFAIENQHRREAGVPLATWGL